MRLSFVPVTEPEEFRDLLIVRNECRDSLTHDTRELDLEDQKMFIKLCWLRQPPIDEVSLFRTDGIDYEPYLLYDDDWPIAYGLLKWDGQKYWMTVGIVKGYRNRGLSRLLVNYITEMGHRDGSEVWLDVHEDNAIARGRYERAGYTIVEQDSEKHGGKMVVMKHVREPFRF